MIWNSNTTSANCLKYIRVATTKISGTKLSHRLLAVIPDENTESYTRVFSICNDGATDIEFKNEDRIFCWFGEISQCLSIDAVEDKFKLRPVCSTDGRVACIKLKRLSAGQHITIGVILSDYDQNTIDINVYREKHQSNYFLKEKLRKGILVLNVLFRLGMPLTLLFIAISLVNAVSLFLLNFYSDVFASLFYITWFMAYLFLIPAFCLALIEMVLFKFRCAFTAKLIKRNISWG